jgi:hypothetical protein
MSVSQRDCFAQGAPPARMRLIAPSHPLGGEIVADTSPYPLIFAAAGMVSLSAPACFHARRILNAPITSEFIEVG